MAGALLIILLIIGGIIYLFFSIVRDVIQHFLGYEVGATVSRLKPGQLDVLQQHFPYYQQLTERQKKIFRKRINYFITSKKFIPREMARVTTEMKVMISACAVQITFGLPPLRLMYFRNILVYPDRYTSASGRQHKGEVNTKVRAIVLSWKDFVEGYAIGDDSFNVGLHEFAHALRVEDAIRNDEFDFFDTKLIGELYQEFKRLEYILKEGKHALIRSYAGANFDEFFAVCVEYFFENPKAFYEHEGGLYTILRLMLKQNPIASLPR